MTSMPYYYSVVLCSRQQHQPLPRLQVESQNDLMQTSLLGQYDNFVRRQHTIPEVRFRLVQCSKVRMQLCRLTRRKVNDVTYSTLSTKSVSVQYKHCAHDSINHKRVLSRTIGAHRCRVASLCRSNHKSILQHLATLFAGCHTNTAR